MQTDKAARLRSEWGDQPCNHPSFDKEYYLGAQTGDYVCLQCGRDFTPTEVDELERKRREPEGT